MHNILMRQGLCKLETQWPQRFSICKHMQHVKLTNHSAAYKISLTMYTMNDSVAMLYNPIIGAKLIQVLTLIFPSAPVVQGWTLIKRYIINALSAVQWNTHISLNTYIYIYSEIQHTYKHSYKAAISAQIQCFYFRHTHSHTRGRCERPAPSLFLVIHL